MVNDVLFPPYTVFIGHNGSKEDEFRHGIQTSVGALTERSMKDNVFV